MTEGISGPGRDVLTPVIAFFCTGPVDMDRVHYCERFIELVIDLEVRREVIFSIYIMFLSLKCVSLICFYSELNECFQFFLFLSNTWNFQSVYNAYSKWRFVWTLIQNISANIKTECFMDATFFCKDTVPHKVAAPASCAHLLLRAAELNRFHLTVCWHAGLAVPGSGFLPASWASPEMSFVLQHYPFTKPRLLEIYTSPL